jgi:hypothetical protein
MGELRHGVYEDECEGLTEKEIYAFYGFDDDEDPYRSDEEEDEAANRDDDGNVEELEVDMEQDEAGSEDIIDPEEGVHTEVHLS